MNPPTSLFIWLVSRRVFLLYFCWWPTSSTNQGKEADKLLRTSTYSSMHSDFYDALLFRDVTIYATFPLGCMSWHADCKQTIKYEQNKLCMLWICSGEILIHPDRAGPLTHLNQMTKSIFFNLSFLCGNLFPIFLLGVWIQYTQVLASVPSKCFSICHLPRITGIIIFYLLIQRGKLGLGFFISVICSCHCFLRCSVELAQTCWCFQGQKDLAP